MSGWTLFWIVLVLVIVFLVRKRRSEAVLKSDFEVV